MISLASSQGATRYTRAEVDGPIFMLTQNGLECHLSVTALTRLHVALECQEPGGVARTSWQASQDCHDTPAQLGVVCWGNSKPGAALNS